MSFKGPRQSQGVALITILLVVVMVLDAFQLIDNVTY